MKKKKLIGTPVTRELFVPLFNDVLDSVAVELDLMLSGMQQCVQMPTTDVPAVLLPQILMLAGYARSKDVDLVDDYDALIERMKSSFDPPLPGSFALFHASIRCIKYANGEYMYDPKLGPQLSLLVENAYKAWAG